MGGTLLFEDVMIVRSLADSFWVPCEMPHLIMRTFRMDPGLDDCPFANPYSLQTLDPRGFVRRRPARVAKILVHPV